jgi:hypothetical protein
MPFELRVEGREGNDYELDELCDKCLRQRQ